MSREVMPLREKAKVTVTHNTNVKLYVSVFTLIYLERVTLLTGTAGKVKKKIMIIEYTTTTHTNNNNRLITLIMGGVRSVPIFFFERVDRRTYSPG